VDGIVRGLKALVKAFEQALGVGNTRRIKQFLTLSWIRISVLHGLTAPSGPA
jgi:hypothetical protein